ncbi:hypothetical protein PIB30_021088 [Stylosanthes scabra]|uniref:Uncharacterized protein n=1 Tax=Stylosanthes scabra TaxID=79078 RepID=A0ABU6Y5U0_9FABA|nr:hypothetical protein [Stylosanthes scabra]
MVDLNRLPEGTSEGSIPDSNIPMAEILDSHDESVVRDPATHDYQLNHDSDNDQEDNESVVVPQGEEMTKKKKMKSLNLDAMNVGSYGFQGGPDEDPVDEFEVGQQFDGKEALLLAVKTAPILDHYIVPVGPARIISQKTGEMGGKDIQWLSFLYALICKARPPQVGLKGYSKCDIFDGPSGSEHKH